MNKAIKQSRISINSILSTKKSEQEHINGIIDETNKECPTITINDMKIANFKYGGAFPFLTNALSELCTENPTFNNGEFVIQGQNDNTTHYHALLKWETLQFLATDNDPLSKDVFRKEILSLFKKSPSLYVKLNNGYSVLTHPFIIRSIIYDDKTTMKKKDLETCEKLGIQKKIAYIDIEFFKPMFADCLSKNPNNGGYFILEHAMFSKLRRTIHNIRNDNRLLQDFSQFYNSQTKENITHYPITYYKFILYFITHTSGNQNATSTTIDAIDMLKHVDPNQLYERNGKTYIKNKYNTKLFIDKASKLFNTMGQMGYCENIKAVIKSCYYGITDTYTINYEVEKPRINKLEPYTSNFFESEIKKNKPLFLPVQDSDSVEL